MRTGLGDQGSQFRVLSPRFAAHCSAVQPFPLRFSRFQLAGISHCAGTSTHSQVDVLSCKTTLFRATFGGTLTTETGTVNSSNWANAQRPPDGRPGPPTPRVPSTG